MFPAPLTSRPAVAVIGAIVAAILCTLGPTGAAAQIPGGAIFDSLVTTPVSPPEKVRIDYLFLAFDGSVRSQPVGRTRMEADSLARVLLVVARSGASFDSLKKAHSDEPRLEAMTLVNKGLRPAAGERTRKMVEIAVGDMAFGMSPGDIGLVVPNNTTCRYGYYVVRRLAE
ncbi:MAG TPA: hypothetical protein VF720_16190 [Candidatus Eisenbacteria bacterium]